MPRTKPYSATNDSLFRPCHNATFFVDGWPTTRAVLCAELSRLAYCSDERVQQVLTESGCTRFQLFHDKTENARIHAHLIKHPTEELTVLAFRGTEPNWENARTDFSFWKSSWEKGGAVHGGFAEALRSIWPQIETALTAVSGTLIYTGHSLGAALATLAATLRRPDFLFTYGSPMVGDRAFAELLAEVPTHRYVNCCDIVCQVPPEMFGFRHVGTLWYVNRDGEVSKAPSLQTMVADQMAARANYLGQYLRPGNVAARDLADHAPINYVTGLAE